MPQFDTQFLSPMLFWTALSFILLLVLLKRFALPGIMAVMEGREERIRQDLEGAERLRKEAEALKAEHQAGIARAKAAADEIVTKAQERATRLLTDNEEKMTREAERIIAEAQRTIEGERTQAVDEIRRLAADLAVTAAGKFVAVSLDESTRERLVDQSLAELAERYRVR